MSAVWFAALQQAATSWYDQGDDLDGAKRALAKIDTSLLGSEVSGAADAFLTTWSTQVRRLATEANEHADSLNQAALNWWMTDMSNVSRLQQLLPWEQRNTQPDHGMPPAANGGE